MKYDAYLYDPEHGWQTRPDLSFSEALRMCKQWRNDWAGSRAVMVPEGQDATPYLQLVAGPRDETVGEDGEFLPYGRCDSCGAPCDAVGCTKDMRHVVAIH